MEAIWCDRIFRDRLLSKGEGTKVGKKCGMQGNSRVKAGKVSNGLWEGVRVFFPRHNEMESDDG